MAKSSDNRNMEEAREKAQKRSEEWIEPRGGFDDFRAGFKHGWDACMVELRRRGAID